MSSFPKTERGLRSRISSYRAELTREKRKYGGISDGRGTRYVIFWLLFLLNDPKESKKYIRWYSKEFDGDIGEPVHKLCLALIFYRMGKVKEARYTLADLMLINRHLIPSLVGIPGPKLKRERSTFDSAMSAEEIPAEIVGAISEAEKAWMGKSYSSPAFSRLLERYIEIETELEQTEVGPKRSRLVKKLSGLLEQHAPEITENKASEADA